MNWHNVTVFLAGGFGTLFIVSSCVGISKYYEEDEKLDAAIWAALVVAILFLIFGSLAAGLS